MTYTVHSIFKTIQGEGAWTGRVAVFCRFAGCNLWSGREEDRSKAICQFCDTDFVGGRKFDTAEKLANEIAAVWGHENYRNRMVVLTGGEPALQYDSALYHSLHARGFYIAMETNGTVPIKGDLDWICVSPKAGTRLQVVKADECKFVFPQSMTPDEAAKMVSADHYTLQPKDGPLLRTYTADAIEYVLDNPEWRLGIQIHKVVGLQ